MRNKIKSLCSKYKNAFLLLLTITITCSGWGYYYYRSEADRKNIELASISNAFVQQYGSDAVIKQFVIPDRVYAATWEDKNKVTHLSWCIAGYWFEVGRSQALSPVQQPPNTTDDTGEKERAQP